MSIIECLLMMLLNTEPNRLEPQRVIIVDVPERKLILYVNGELEKSYPVAVGKPSSPTPIGSFKVMSIVSNPSYYNPAVGKFGAGDPANPVGTRWMGLSVKGYGIHGTRAPKSIGRAASRGCIRMNDRDAEDLSGRIKVGDAVEIKYEITKQNRAKDIYKRYNQIPAIAALP